jgi:circadian clock protein KaiC
MLGGGLFRGSTTLITGAPGTSKTTLAGQFADGACRRGERTLYVSFDEGGERIRRNLMSVGIRLDRHVKSGLLRMYSGRTDVTNPEQHLIRIAALILEHRPRCMVIDPLSAIARTGALSSARAVGNRLIHKVKDHYITALIASLVGAGDPQARRPSCRSRRLPIPGSICRIWCAAASVIERLLSSSPAAHATPTRCGSSS